jgi:molybdopterin-binding protein
MKINVEGLISNLELEITENATLTAIITRQSADELELKEGDTINIVIKPTEIIIKDLEE